MEKSIITMAAWLLHPKQKRQQCILGSCNLNFWVAKLPRKKSSGDSCKGQLLTQGKDYLYSLRKDKQTKYLKTTGQILTNFLNGGI